MPGEDRTDVENAIIDLYLGKKGGVAFLQSFGLIGGGSNKGKNEDVKEEDPTDEDKDFHMDGNLNDFGEPEGREDNSDELPSPNFIKSQILENTQRRQRSSRSLQKLSYAQEEENDGWDEGPSSNKEDQGLEVQNERCMPICSRPYENLFVLLFSFFGRLKNP